MKKSILLLLFNLFLFNLYSQDVPIINTTITAKLEYTDKEIRDWNSYIDICTKYNVYEGGFMDRLTPNDKKKYTDFLSSYNKSADEIDSFEYDAPWSMVEPGCSWYCGAIFVSNVSSSLASKGNNNYGDSSLLDDDTRTAWVEGVDGYGIGEYIEIIFPYFAPRATSCAIANGYNKNETTWRNNSRVKTFNVYEDDVLIAILNLQDTRNLQYFELPHPIPNRDVQEEHGALFVEGTNEEEINRPVTLKFVITEVYKGDKFDDTAISEITFDGIDVHCLAKGTQVMMSNHTEKSIEDIKIGDVILSYNMKNKLFEPKEVKHIHRVNHNNMLRLKLNDREILTTDDHPFLTKDGWKSFNPSKTKGYKRYSSTSVARYQVGDSLLIYEKGKTSEMKIESITPISKSTETYTLELDDNVAFIANGLIVGQE